MKCKCGNELGKARVSPYPVSYVDIKSKQEVFLLFGGGFTPLADKWQCWYCTFPRRG